MPIKILMPALSPTMTEGNLTKWLKQEGDILAPGDVMAEIETDKATMEVEAVDAGILGKILVPAGTENVAVNALIAWVLEEGETAIALEGLTNTEEKNLTAASAPTAGSVTPTAATLTTLSAQTPPSNNKIFASPLAKRIAAQQQIDLTTVQGTGPNGRIVKTDVEQAMTTSKAASIADVLPQQSNTTLDVEGFSSFNVVPHSNMRKVIAKRLVESKLTVPHFYLSVDCEISRLLALRQEINHAQPAQKISVNDMIIRACAIALRDVPAANTSWTDQGMRQFDHADIAVAVALDGGLITPIIRSAQNKNLGSISNEMKNLVERARANKLKPEEFTGGTFSISNLGMFGIKQFNAIVNPPHGCILAVGAGEERPIVKQGQLAIGQVMTCTLSVDHRVVDGAVGAQFMAAFKDIIESPLRVLL